MNQVLKHLFEEKTLTESEAKNLIIELSNGKINTTQSIAIISVYNMRNPTLLEIKGFKKAIMELSIKLNFNDFNAIDIVGTGGDGKNTFNISTLACFIVAGTGKKVIKHGNFGYTSTTGSSNLLKELGCQFTNQEDKLKYQLDKVGICYLHSPIFHPCLNHMMDVRKNLGVRTIFNVLGPLLNPGYPKNQLLGVSNLELARIYNYLYQEMDSNYSIIHSVDGYDEITLTNDVKCYTSRGERYYYMEQLVNKKHVNVNPFELRGGNNIKDNVRTFINILSGKGSIFQNTVVLTNATFALNIMNCDSFEENYNKAEYALTSGRAKNVLKKFLSV
ncbi:anthranilate phosphoribosyltransferase [Blattabacterium cuenoti]|uniref:anthranilate phosphoribosyltransferase n=1 Tax=Blattabacterium cuenoti TaxID=1653831 RepID=UPI00163C3A31|nr:anthranilate phosphoribosyltransferase [Blattabacterium cuenoti]